MKPKFVIYTDKKGEWRWTLHAGNGKIIADGSEGYHSKEAAERALGRFVQIMSGLDAINYEVLQ